MNKLITLLFISAIFFLGVSSCKKDPASAPDLGYNYFPDQAGSYVIYNVDSFYYDDFYNPSKIDTTRFQLKEKIESVFTDGEGRPALRLERYVKYYDPAVPYSQMSWTLRNVWTETKTLRTAEKVEENVRYIKLAFPVKESQEWNGNAQNTLGAENYKYNFFDKARTIGNIRFDSVLQVDQYDELDLVHRKHYEEKYARNVGLIFKRVIDISSQPDGVPDSLLSLFYGTDIMLRVDAGVQYTMTITSFGRE